MKRGILIKVRSVFVVFFAVTALILSPGHAQTSKKSLPQVPITYAADTEETILRRAQWIEGARKEGNSVTLWGILRPDLALKEIAEFNKVYPQIKVDYWRGEGEEIATKMEGEFMVGRLSVDVAYGGEPVNYPRWREKGMLQKFTDFVPGLAKMDPRMFSSLGDSVQAGNNASFPQYNTKLVSAAEAPKSWEGLLDPKWKGKQIGVPMDPKAWWTIALGQGGWGIEKTKDYLKKLMAQNPIIYKGMPEGIALLGAGEFKITSNNYSTEMQQAQQRGSPLDWCRVSPILITGPSVIMIKGGPHPNATRLFLEWYLSPQGLAVHEAITWYGVAFPGAGSRLSKLMEGRSLVVRTEEVILEAARLGIDVEFRNILSGM